MKSSAHLPVDPLVLRPHVPDDQPVILQPAPAPAVVHEVPVLVPGVVAVMLPPPLHPVTQHNVTNILRHDQSQPVTPGEPTASVDITLKLGSPSTNLSGRFKRD